MELRIKNPEVPYSVRSISSKSDAHRALICAALSDVPVRVVCPDVSEDIEATARVLRGIGAEIEYRDEGFYVIPVKTSPNDHITLDCGESGSTLRFMLPVCAALGLNVRFTGRGRLLARPLSELTACLESHGCEIRKNDGEIELRGKLEPGIFEIAGNISSQYITGLLLALPLFHEKSTVKIKGTLESAPYVDITLRVLEAFGVKAVRGENGFEITAEGYKSPEIYTVEGDWSNAAFFLVCGAIGKHEVRLSGLNMNSAQGDRAIFGLLEKFGADMSFKNGGVIAKPAPLHGIEIEARDIPDLVPALSVCAAAAQGETVIKGVKRLRLKESNRIETVSAMIKALGGSIVSDENSITVFGCGHLKGGKVCGSGDHRIVMSAAAASLICENEVIIENAEAAGKSYPAFFDVFMAE